MLIKRLLNSPYYKIGGVTLVAKRRFDMLFKRPDRMKEYLYDIFSKAGSERYPELIKEWWRIYAWDLPGDSDVLTDPHTFNEKIQWLKAYDSTPLKTLCSDKYLVRGWLKEKIGEKYLVPLLGVWERFEDINFNELPDKFALKCNHGSGWNCIVDNKENFDIEKARMLFDRWMKKNFAFTGMEIHYKNIVPKIIAEEYLEGGPIKDFRFFCFNGEPKQVWVDLFSGTGRHIRSIYDMNWNKQEIKCTWPDGGDQLSEKPVNFDLMVSLSRILSIEFSFVRVDFFEVNGNLYMGEMTFTPMNGVGIFEPGEWDYRLGDMLQLPEEKYIFK